MEITFVDWFAGIGGLRHGLEKASEIRPDTQPGCGDQEGRCLPRPEGRGWRVEQEFRCVGSCEIDRYARHVYARNFGHEPEWGDSRAVDPAELPDFDLLCAGFPCQGFSVAGQRRGFGDVRGTLFFEICRIVRHKRPRLLLLENVKGLLSNDKGRTFQTILESLDELGYDLQWEVLNSKNFGVPQNRERVFIVGHLRGEPRPQVFPLREDTGEDPAEDGERMVQTEDITGCIQEGNGRRLRLDGSSTFVTSPIDVNYWRGVGYDRNQRTIIAATAYTKSNRRASRGQEAETYPCLDGSQAYAVYHENKSGQRTPHAEAQALRAGVSHNYQTIEYPEIANAVDCDGYLRRMGVHHDSPICQYRLRRLTPLECERLQGFPDGWTEGISDTQRYKCLGNAVTVSVIEAIGCRLLEEIRGIDLLIK